MTAPERREPSRTCWSEHATHRPRPAHRRPSSALSAVAARLESTPMSVALAWLLQRSPNILLIPGTSSTAHLREKVAGAGLSLSDEDLTELNKIGH